MKCYKGFDKDLKCRDHQYEVGKSYEEPEAKLCEKGYHACEYPLDVFNYYAPADSRYCEVELDGVDDTTSDDSKKCGTKIAIKAEIGIAGIVKAAVDFTTSKINSSKINTNTGDQSAAANTGNRSAATNTGYQSAATNTGDQSAATNTGNRSAATVEGKESIAICTGRDGKAKGALGCWIALAEWDEGGKHIVDFKSARVDGDVIKADVFYVLKDGNFIEAEVKKCLKTVKAAFIGGRCGVITQGKQSATTYLTQARSGAALSIIAIKKLTEEDIKTANKKPTPKQKAGIVRLRFEEGMTVTDIAAKYGLCKTTAFNVLNEYKKHGYTLPESEPETAYVTDEETERAVDDEPCYEVTGDTDIDAYMADRSKKEPAPAATETSSEEVYDSENIIPQSAENVKREILPEAVVKAVTNAIKVLNKRTIEIDKRVEGLIKARSQLIDVKRQLVKDCVQLCNYLIKYGYKDVLMVLEDKKEEGD